MKIWRNFLMTLKADKRLFYGSAVAAAGLVILIAAILFLPGGKKPAQNQKIQSADAITDTCQQNNTTTYSCYKKELQSIVQTNGPETAFSFVKRQYKQVAYVKTQCHQLSHVIGRAAYAKYGDLTNTFAHGDQFCWSGYYHGVMEEVTTEKGADYTIKNADSICAPLAAKQKYSFYHYNCVHGLGHGFMEALEGNLFASLDACNKLTDTWEASSCYGGTFMQNIMNEQSPDETADHKSAYLKPSEPMYPCTALVDKYKLQCYLMQTSYVLQVDNYDFAKVFQACGAIEPAYQYVCYQSLGRDASGQSIYNPEAARNSCLLGPTQTAKDNCVVGAVRDFVSNFHAKDQAYDFCGGLPASMQANCKAAADSYYTIF